MRIDAVKITNFKTFEKLDLKLNDFNVLIGANASGKSSFVQFFKFFKDITTSGFNNAIALQGGVDYLRNVNIGASVPLTIEISFGDIGTNFSMFFLGNDQKVELSKFNYRIVIGFNKRHSYKVLEDKIELEYIFSQPNVKTDSSSNNPNLLKGYVTFTSINGRPRVTQTIPNEIKLRPEYKDLPIGYLNSFPLKGNLLIETPFILYPFIDTMDLSAISLYDFDSKLPKKSVSISSKADLDSDGSNLAIVLKNLLDEPKKKKEFTRLLADILPFVQNIKVEGLADKSFLFKIQELYNSNMYLPASFLSDGTIGIIALILALYFNRSSGIVIIEEPERNIHPSLISKIVSMMKDVSLRKQILITTHNVEVLKHTDVSDLLLISRLPNGFSQIQRPVELEYVKTFLAQELGIEDLFIQNLLS